MTILQKIKLSGQYGKGIYIVSALVTLAAGGLVTFYPMMIPVCVILKLLSIPLVLYMFMYLKKDSAMYFYLNLGFSRIEYYTVPIAVEFVFFAICMIITGSIGYANC